MILKLLTTMSEHSNKSIKIVAKFKIIAELVKIIAELLK